MPSPMPMIGPISGEMSIAPIITATLSVFNPNDAMNMANTRMRSCAPLNDTPERIDASVTSCGSKSALTLKNDFNSA